MLQAIPAAEVGTDGRALEVRYGAAPGRPGLLVVTVLAHAVEGGPDHVRRSELALVVAGERMGREAMRARVEAEARRAATARVAWVEETRAPPLGVSAARAPSSLPRVSRRGRTSPTPRSVSP